MTEAERKRAQALAAAGGRLVTSRPWDVRWLLCGRGRPVDASSPAAGYTVVLDGDSALALYPDIEDARVRGEERLDELGYELVPYPWHEGHGLEDTPPVLDVFRLELDAAAELALEARRRGFTTPVVLVAGDERQRVHRHPLPTPARLGRHALLAITAEREGLHVSMSRLVAFGKPPDELAAIVRACAEVDAAVIAASRPGATLADVFAAGADAYAAQGFPEEWRKHHQGGLTGYRGREVFATPVEVTTIPSSAAVAWNPSITGGAKSEDTVLVAAGGVEVVTRTEDLGELETAGPPRPAVVEL